MNQTPLLLQWQLSDLLNVSTRTLERWRVEGVGPIYVKVGRRVLYRREDVETWLTERVRHSTSEMGGHRG
jgi:excisionase family DNA binding protein